MTTETQTSSNPAGQPAVSNLVSTQYLPRSIFRWTLIVLSAIATALLVAFIAFSLKNLIFVVILSSFFAYMLAPLVRVIHRPFIDRGLERFITRPIAIGFVYLLVFTSLGTGIAYIAPSVAEQGREFGSNLPAYAASVRQAFQEINRRFERLRVPEEVQTRINEHLVIAGDSIAETFSNFVINVATYSPWLIIIPILSFFLLKDVDMIRLAILEFFPDGHLRHRIDKVLVDVNSALAAYMRAQFISCIFIGVICTAAFYFIGLRYALLLGILAGLFEFVPMIGPLLIGVGATALAAFGAEPRRAVYVAIFLIILRLFHDYVSYPRIIRGGIHLHPLLIILSVLAGEQIGGIPGVFLAIPIVAVLAVIYRHILEHHGNEQSAAQYSETFDAASESVTESV